MKYRVYILFIIGVVLSAGLARADEGMWMIHAIDAALEKKMQERGLELSAREIYNADAPGTSVADAVVSLEFGCTGSIISDRGLLITNHHCAYSDVHRLSTPEHNYLEEGFWAMRSDEEKNIPDKKVYFLKKVVDVTDEVMELEAQLKAEGRPFGMRRLSHLMEKRYKESTGLEAWLSSMWKGSRYYMALYQVYADVRLVAAPPVSSAAFGGDIDNWEWPQHKCDFAMYRVYTAPDGSPAEYSEDNVPMKPAARLKISLDGYKPGDYTMVIGYPGSTNRYSSSFETDFNETLKLPIANRLRGDQMAIIKEWMDSDPQVRLKYSDYYFSLSNVQEYCSGEVECFDRFDVVESKEALEKELQEWISADPERKARWGTLLNDLKAKYSATQKGERDVNYLRESLVRGTRISRVMHRITSYRADDTRDLPGIMKKEYDNKGRTVDFKNTILIMTSNVGADIIQSYMERLPMITNASQSDRTVPEENRLSDTIRSAAQRSAQSTSTGENGLDGIPSEAEGRVDESMREALLAECRTEVLEVLKRTVRPEFLNRIDEVIMFEPLSQTDIRDILRMQMSDLRSKLAENGVNISFTGAFEEYMSTKGYEPAYGARPIKRLMQKELVNLLAKSILDGHVRRDSVITIDVQDGQIVVR